MTIKSTVPATLSHMLLYLLTLINRDNS